MKSYATLQDLVNEVIEEKIANGESFSAHDITKVIRDLCNTHDVEIKDLAMSMIGGVNTYWIFHNDVRMYVRGFDMNSNGYVSEFNGTFTVYKKEDVVNQSTPATLVTAFTQDQINEWFEAADTDDVDTVKKFLDMGFDVNTKNDGGSTLLVEAAYFNAYNIMKYLLTTCTDLDIECEDEVGNTALDYCDTDEIIDLIKNYKYKQTVCNDCSEDEDEDDNNDCDCDDCNCGEDLTINEKIEDYINRKLAKNEYPTFKQIQGRFKNDHLSLKDIEEYVEDLEYVIHGDDDNSIMSKWWVE